MEKQTIGKFIAALRKAHGMTQKELGEKLYLDSGSVLSQGIPGKLRAQKAQDCRAQAQQLREKSSGL